MTKRQSSEIKGLSNTELASRIVAAEKEIFDARFKLSLGQLSDRSKVWRLRKGLARMKTLLTKNSKAVG